MSDSQDFDPRFDPAFQRGFSGDVATGRRRGLSGTPSAMPAVAAPPEAEPLPVVSPPEPVERASVHEAEAVAPVVVPPRFFTPWTIAIAAVGVLLILGGAWGVNQLIESLASSDEQASTNFYVVLLGLFASPLAVAVGVAALIGLLFLGALRRR